MTRRDLGVVVLGRWGLLVVFVSVMLNCVGVCVNVWVDVLCCDHKRKMGVSVSAALFAQRVKDRCSLFQTWSVVDMQVVRDTLKPATSAGGYPVAEALFPATLRTAEDKAIEEKDDF